MPYPVLGIDSALWECLNQMFGLEGRKIKELHLHILMEEPVTLEIVELAELQPSPDIKTTYNLVPR